MIRKKQKKGDKSRGNRKKKKKKKYGNNKIREGKSCDLGVKLKDYLKLFFSW